MGKKICTFMWKNEHYLVDDLNKWVKENCSESISPFIISDDYLREIDPNRNWGNYKIENETIAVRLPMTMLDIVEHFKRALKADYSPNYPIVVLHTPPTSTGKTCHILDGMHRLLHAATDGKHEVEAYHLSLNMLDEFKLSHKPIWCDKLNVPEVGTEGLDCIQFEWQ